MTDKKDIVITEPHEAPGVPMAFDPQSILVAAASSGAAPETIEKWLAMRRELKAEWARDQFMAAMAKCQAAFPTIGKDTKGGVTKAGFVAYKYATLDSIVSQTRKMIGENGFSYAIKVDINGSQITATCIVRHSAGHQEESSFTVPKGGGTNIMSEAQIVASAMSFAKRYAFCNAFGIITGDADDDATPKTQGAADGAFVPKSQFEKAREMISKIKNRDDLLRTKEMVATSRYTEEEKEALICLIDEKL